jgi:RNA polymerase sigma-70 factor (ECF subfamily)
MWHRHRREAYPVPEPTDFTQQFRAARNGDAAALDALLPAVYGELKQIARAQLARERPGHTLQATALVHEAYLRLLGVASVDWSDRAWFMGLAATMMRRILVNHARDRLADKRGGGAVHVALAVAEAVPEEGIDLLGLHDALDALAVLDPRQARVVELKYFAGMEIEEIALVLDVSSATVRRAWTLAKLWLARELKR